MASAIQVFDNEAKFQLSIVYTVFNSMKQMAWKDYKLVTIDLKQVHQTATEE